MSGKPETLGALLASLRAAEGQSLAEFAEPLGVTRTRLHDIECGRHQVSVARAAQWALVLEREPAEFVQLVLQSQVDAAGLRLRVKVTANPG